MSGRELKFWMACHAAVLLFVFSVLFVVQREDFYRLKLPLLPETIQESTFGKWLTRNMGAVSADLWIYFQQSQYILRGNLDPAFQMYKFRNTGESEGTIVEKEGLRLPYRDSSFEYPPLAIIPILIPGLFTTDQYFYRIYYSLLASLAYLFSLWTFLKIYRDVRGDEGSR